MPGLRGRTDQAALSVAKFDLGLHLDESPDGTIRGHLGYATDLFTESTARTLAESFLGCLTDLTTAPDTPLTAT
jgi:hypothetical protein